MKIFIISLLISLSLLSVSGKSYKNGARIVGGSAAAIGQFPWQVLNYVEFPGNVIGFSGSSLISATRALTAAHNWYDGTNQGIKLTVYLGSNILGGGLEMVALEVVMHEQFDSFTLKNDIAIIRLNDVSFTNNIQPIALPSGLEVNNDFAGSDAVATGFGVAEDGDVPGYLKYVELKIMSNQQCSQALGILGMFVEPTNICTSGEGTVGTCTGDSGGPLVVYRDEKAYLVGVTSFGSSTCFGSLPSAFTRVTSYESWIENNL